MAAILSVLAVLFLLCLTFQAEGQSRSRYEDFPFRHIKNSNRDYQTDYYRKDFQNGRIPRRNNGDYGGYPSGGYASGGYASRGYAPRGYDDYDYNTGYRGQLGNGRYEDKYRRDGYYTNDQNRRLRQRQDDRDLSYYYDSNRRNRPTIVGVGVRHYA